MAQTKEQIYQDILDAIAASPTLASQLTSTSSVAIWNQYATAIASVLQTSQALGDIQEADLTAIAAAAPPSTLAWWQRQVKAFQYGDQININTDLSISYTTPDPTKQIITQCSVQESLADRLVLIKVATGASASTLEPITGTQLSALKAYINKIKPAGIRVNAISLEPDRVQVFTTIYYSGELDPVDVKANVITAIDTYLQSLPFNGQLMLSKLEDAIQAVTGVVDVTLDSIIGRPYSTPVGGPGLAASDRVYDSQAGYIIPEDTTGFTFDDTISLVVA